MTLGNMRAALSQEMVNLQLKNLWKLFGTQLKFSSTFHLQIDSHTKVIGYSLGIFLRFQVDEMLMKFKNQFWSLPN